MIRSMTGFGRAEGVVHDRKLTVEVRSLNSKQLDLFLKVPSALKERENEIRLKAGERIVRGKAEVFVGSDGIHATKRTSFDRELVRAYYKIREGRVRKRIFEMVKAVGAASHAEVLGGRKARS